MNNLWTYKKIYLDTTWVDKYRYDIYFMGNPILWIFDNEPDAIALVKELNMKDVRTNARQPEEANHEQR